MPTPPLLPEPLPPLLLPGFCLALLLPLPAAAAVLEISWMTEGLLLGAPVGARLMQGGVTTRSN
jgi:hypothetical protein